MDNHKKNNKMNNNQNNKMNNKMMNSIKKINEKINNKIKIDEKKNNRYLNESEEEQKKIRSIIDLQEEKKLKSICSKDNDCKSNEVCAFNENDEKHYCIPNKLYLGCLKSKDKMYRHISSTNDSDVKDIQSCNNFVRKLNNPEIIYDYIVYKSKVETPIKKQSIQVNLKCGNMKLVSFPYSDNFEEECNVYNEICTIKPKKNMINMIKSNLDNCTKEYHLEIKYKCDIENREKIIKVPIDKEKIEDMTIELTCPIDGENSKYQAKCTAFTLEDNNQMNLASSFDSFIIQQKCELPSYLVPNIIKDLDAYQLKKKDTLQKKVEKFEDIISEDEEDLAKKKALQYMLDYEKKYNKKISYQDALSHVKRIIEHATNEASLSSSTSYWDSTTGLNKIPLERKNGIYNDNVIGNNKIYNSYSEILNDSSVENQINNADYIVYFNNNDTIPEYRRGKGYVLTQPILYENNKNTIDTWMNQENAITLIRKFKWDTTTGLNKIPFERSNDKYDNLVRVGGVDKIYNSFSEVLNDPNVQAQLDNSNYVVYFFNIDSIPPYRRGKAYILTHAILADNNKLSINTWSTQSNAITLINTSEQSTNDRNAELINDAASDINSLQESISNSMNELKNLYDKEINQLSKQDDEMDKTLNMMTQRIQNLNYQSQVNKTIIKYMYIILIVVFIIALAYFVYMYKQ